MQHLTKISFYSRWIHRGLSLFILLIPLYYGGYWTFINKIPQPILMMQSGSGPDLPLSIPLQAMGFAASLLPMTALIYGTYHLRRLFADYRDGRIFSFHHVARFKHTAMALLFWLVASIVYASVQSVLFTIQNPPGSRSISVGFGSVDLTTLVVGIMIRVIAWVMEEGQILAKEQELTI